MKWRFRPLWPTYLPEEELRSIQIYFSRSKCADIAFFFIQWNMVGDKRITIFIVQAKIVTVLCAYRAAFFRNGSLVVIKRIGLRKFAVGKASLSLPNSKFVWCQIDQHYAAADFNINHELWRHKTISIKLRVWLADTSVASVASVHMLVLWRGPALNFTRNLFCSAFNSTANR